MKIKSILLAGLIALGFMACNNEDVPQVDATNASMTVKINQAATRAVGADPVAAEKAIKRLEVFVYNGNVIDGYGIEEGVDVTEVTKIAVTTGSRSIIVVANAPTAIGQVTKDALKAKVAELTNYQTATNGLLMTAEETTAFNIVAGDNFYGKTGTGNVITETPIALTRVVARVALVKAEVNFIDAFAGWTFEPAEVFVFNVPGKSNYFNPVLVDGNFLSGMGAITDASGIAAVNGDGSAWLKNEVTDLSILPTTPAYYYAFENKGVTPTVLTIKGELYKPNNDPTITDAEGNQLTHVVATATDLPGSIDENGYTYYSVLVNAEREGYDYDTTHTPDGKLLRNTQYNISVNIKRPGADDPIDPPAEQAKLDVAISVVNWTKVDQGVEF